MPRYSRAFVLGLAMLPGAGGRVHAAPGGPPDFQSEILPVLYHRCFSCHSEKQARPKADLRLDSAAGLRESGVIKPGQPEDSELMARVSLPAGHADVMPPAKGGGQPLAERERELLRRWIAAGAPVGAWERHNHRQPAADPAGPPLDRGEVPRLAREVDRLMHADLAARGISLHPPVDEAAFLRRVYLDVAGRIPTRTEREKFLADPAPDRRARLITALLTSEAYVSHTYNWRADQLRIASRIAPGQPGWLYGDWVKESIRAGLPADELVRRLITAEGHLWDNGAVGFYLRDLGMPLDHMSNLMRVFLGTRIECAQCHDHPSEPITQKDFYQLTAYTYGVANLRNASGYSTENVREWRELQARLKAMDAPAALRDSVSRTTSYLKRRTTDTEHRLVFPEDYAADPVARGAAAELHTLFGDEAPADEANRRKVFAEWLTSPRNPRFARNLANRLWQRVFGRGLVEPVDSLSPFDQLEQPVLLEFLTRTLVRLGFDERAFLAVLLNTELYAAAADAADAPEGTAPVLRGPVARRLSAEQVWDSFLVLLVPDVDERRARPDLEHAELNPARLASLARMNADELLQRAEVELDYRRRQRAHRLEAEERRAAIRAAREKGDSAAVAELEERQAAAERVFERFRDSVGMGVTRVAPETDPRWKGLPAGLRRASELPSPMEFGHFLRQFGQSDRREVDAFSRSPRMTHALTLMNGELTARVLAEGSLVRREAAVAGEGLARLRALFNAVLVREPDGRELARCAEVLRDSGTPEQDVLWALLNSPEFLFQF